MPVSEDAFIKAIVQALDHAETQVSSDVLRAIERHQDPIALTL